MRTVVFSICLLATCSRTVHAVLPTAMRFASCLVKQQGISRAMLLGQNGGLTRSFSTHKRLLKPCNYGDPWPGGGWGFAAAMSVFISVMMYPDRRADPTKWLNKLLKKRL